MSRKPTLRCVTPYGTFQRGTYRKYTHVLVEIQEPRPLDEKEQALLSELTTTRMLAGPLNMIDFAKREELRLRAGGCLWGIALSWHASLALALQARTSWLHSKRSKAGRAEIFPLERNSDGR